MRNIFKQNKPPPSHKEGRKDFYKRCTTKYHIKFSFLTKPQIKAKVDAAWKRYQKKQFSDDGKENLSSSFDSNSSSMSLDNSPEAPTTNCQRKTSKHTLRNQGKTSKHILRNQGKTSKHILRNQEKTLKSTLQNTKEIKSKSVVEDEESQQENCFEVQFMIDGKNSPNNDYENVVVVDIDAEIEMVHHDTNILDKEIIEILNNDYQEIIEIPNSDYREIIEGSNREIIETDKNHKDEEIVEKPLSTDENLIVEESDFNGQPILNDVEFRTFPTEGTSGKGKDVDVHDLNSNEHAFSEDGESHKTNKHGGGEPTLFNDDGGQCKTLNQSDPLIFHCERRLTTEKNDACDQGDSGFLTDLFTKRVRNQSPIKTKEATGRSLLMVPEGEIPIEKFDFLDENDIFL